MPVRILDWSTFGSNGVDLVSGTTVDTGGVGVTFGFVAEDEGAAARNFELEQYVAPGEAFDPTEGLKLFGAGGEGGVDNTSTSSLTFGSTDPEFGDAVTDVSFRINDLDLGQGGQDYTDVVTIRAYDADGNLVPVTLTPGADILVSGDTATGNDSAATQTSPAEPGTSLLVSIPGPITRIEIDYDNAGPDEQAVWVTDVQFTTTDAENGALTAVDDVIVTDEDSEGMVIATANDTDPEGDDIEIVSVDTTGLNGDVTIDPDNDTLVYDPNGQYEHLGTGETAEETFTYTVTDGNGNTDTATVTVTINGVNDDPDAMDDDASTDPGAAVTIPVLANDTDPESDPLTVDDATDGTNGTTTVNGDGTVTYTPNPGFIGTDTFTYTITDPEGGTDTATVTVTVGDPSGPDGYVDGTGGDDLIDDAYTGDPNGDMIDDNDQILPGEGENDDIVRAGDGDDTVLAGDGDDDVFAGDGNDSVEGDVGDDILRGEDGDDTLDGGDGDDTIEGGDGNDTVYGGDGNDVIETDSPTDDLLDAETFVGVPVDPDPDNDRDFVDAGAGDDTITNTGDDADTVLGGAGNDVIDTGIDDDVIEGGDGNDDITGGQGSDDIDGGAGDDTINAGDDLFSDYVGDDPNLPNPLLIDPATGLPAESDPNPDDNRDTVSGGEGNDVIMTGDDADEISGDEGNDTIDAGIDDDVIDGGTGDDSILGGHGSDTIDGGDGDDFINAGDPALAALQAPDETDPVPENGRDLVDGGAGNDTILGEDDDDTLIGGLGDDSIDGGLDDDSIDGNDGDDTLIGGDGSDTVNGGDGNDVIDTSNDGTTPVLPDEGYNDPTDVPVDTLPDDDRDLVSGGMGDDTITTGDDADTIFAGFGNDVIDGGIDDDEITASVGDDSVIGGEGDDLILGGRGNDTIEGDGGIYGDEIANDGSDPEPTNNEDTISGGSGNDVIMGGDDNDVLNGGIGDDTVDGGVDDDEIVGNDGNDVLIGGDGDDTIRGGNGNDTISGGDGNDVLEGRGDRDTFEDVGAGDVVDGGTGGDDFDTMDLTGQGDFRIVGETVDADGDSTSGTVEFLDADGNVTGSLQFTEIENIIPCFTPGTVIATPRGERRVEDLKVGDRIITRDNGLQEIRWVGTRALSGQELAQAPNLRPVLIRAGSLGQGLPERDLLVSPQHRVLMNSDRAALYFEEREVLAAAKHLVDLDGVDIVDASSTTYIHFMFDQHEVVLSNGSWTESFQPGEQVMDGMGNEQRDEIYTLFPELREAEGLKSYQAARRSLKKHEAKLLVK